MARTRMNAKGQIMLPKALRDAHGFKAGAEFEVIDSGGEVRLKVLGGQGGAFDPTDEKASMTERKGGTLTLEEFRAMVPVYNGPPMTDRMIREAVLAEARRKWDEENRQWNHENSD